MADDEMWARSRRFGQARIGDYAQVRPLCRNCVWWQEIEPVAVEPIRYIETPIVPGLEIFDNVLTDPETAASEIDTHMLGLQSGSNQQIEHVATAPALVVAVD